VPRLTPSAYVGCPKSNVVFAMSARLPKRGGSLLASREGLHAFFASKSSPCT
jgi:hypothetical protein